MTAGLFRLHDHQPAGREGNRVVIRLTMGPHFSVSVARRDCAKNSNNQSINRICPVCKTIVRKDRLAQHIAKVHNTVRPPAQGPMMKPARADRKALRGERDMIPVRNRAQFVGLRKQLVMESVEAEEWAIRALSPCDERVQNGRQIPDGSSANSAVVTSRIITAITPPPGDTTELWNFLAIVPPFPDLAFAYKVWKSSQTVDDVTWTPVPYRNVSPGHLDVYSGTSGPQLSPNLVSNSTLDLETEQIRQTMKGLTFNLNASALTNQGMVLAAQYGDKITKASDYPITTSSSPDPPPADVTQGAWIVEDVPTTTDQIFAKDTHAMRGPARLGAYLPLKFNDQQSDYQPLSLNRYKVDSTSDKVNDGPLPIVFKSTSDVQALGTNNFLCFAYGPSGTGHSDAVVSPSTTNMQTGVVYFEGLSPQASMDVKTVAAVEVIPKGESTWTGFAEESPESAPTAQIQVHNIQRRTPSAFPASYNFLGTLLTSLLPALGSVATELVTGLIKKFTAGKAEQVANATTW